MSASIGRGFICIDEGLSALLHVSKRDESKNWRVSLGQVNNAKRN